MGVDLSERVSCQKSKRMRTSFKHHQLRSMQNFFTHNHNPDAKDLKELSQKTGLTKRVLQVRRTSPDPCLTFNIQHVAFKHGHKQKSLGWKLVFVLFYQIVMINYEFTSHNSEKRSQLYDKKSQLFVFYPIQASMIAELREKVRIPRCKLAITKLWFAILEKKVRIGRFKQAIVR